jgi:FAD/FMN-containing dehydrogenase
MSVLMVMTNNGEDHFLDRAAIENLRSCLAGELLTIGDDGYEEARQVWNGMIDKRPALIARCRNTDDVITTVNFVRHNNVLLAVRGGGHNVAGFATCDGGLVIDLSLMNRVQVNPQTLTVRVGGGAKLGDLDQATQEYGLAIPAGVVSDTGVAGLTLGGGLGWLRSKYGLTCDNMIAAEVVTADGRLVLASETENEDLFWGLRGGGGNFGIVTTFEFQAHFVGPQVWFTAAFHDGRHMKEALQFYRHYTATAPDEVSILAACGHFPPGAEMFPEEVHGLPFVLFVGMYAGLAAEGQRVMQPLRDFHQPLVDFSGVMPYVEAQQFYDEDYPARELRYYWKSLNLTDLSDAAIQVIVEYTMKQPSPLTTTDIWHIGGAIRRLSEDDSAFVGRHVPFLFTAEANWALPGDDEINIAWAREYIQAMSRFSDGSQYFNFPGFNEEGEQAIRATFGVKYDQLVALKNKYDPHNLFRLNQNIKPTALS